MIKIGFFGTPHFAKKVLEDLYNSSKFEIAFVVTGIDKPVGRSQALTPTPVKEFALSKDLKIIQPQKIRGNDEFLNEIKTYQVDYLVVVAYGKILPNEVLEVPKKICINVHGSILPLYRGASPIQSSLIAGDSVTGLTIMKMSEGMDEGDIIDVLSIGIDKFDTSETLFTKFEEVSGDFLTKTLIAFDEGKKPLQPQNSEDATYCKKITKEDGLLDFTKSAPTLFHLWKGLTPWPGIFTSYEDKKLIITKCDYLKEEIEGKTGEVIKGEFGIGIKCGEGILILKEVKLEGKGKQNISDFVNGRKNFIGTVL
ncbi:MAG: methionyl-tRNA formyltransferase [Candidatus Gracilibacteria bacterium]|nr:methionyl-tRNA formyltransferase [Candidatus Gracilibacteria bacterium]MDD2908823.1 methionyl-tRNA formyltransferase [Candidatus Gracilibacteria bacterium]